MLNDKRQCKVPDCLLCVCNISRSGDTWRIFGIIDVRLKKKESRRRQKVFSLIIQKEKRKEK